VDNSGGAAAVAQAELAVGRRGGYRGGMNDTKLYEQIMGIQSPWSVQSVALKKAERMIEVEVVCAETLWGCPECGQRMHKHDTERRRWRHLDSCQFKTILVADVPRVKCPEHGT
jgi:transposase